MAQFGGFLLGPGQGPSGGPWVRLGGVLVLGRSWAGLGGVLGGRLGDPWGGHACQQMLFFTRRSAILELISLIRGFRGFSGNGVRSRRTDPPKPRPGVLG